MLQVAEGFSTASSANGFGPNEGRTRAVACLGERPSPLTRIMREGA